jgi:formamidopyrimidine-DNA glycosylase
MPELPEVETMRRGVAPAVGCRIVDVEALPCPRKPIGLAPDIEQMRRRLRDTTIVATERAGKRVALRLDSGDRLVFEPRMTGLLLLGDSPDPLYGRLRVALCGGTVREIVYWDRRGLGNVRLATEAEFAARYGADHLGPDALEATGMLLRARLGASARPLKTALLDQRAIAGIGNLYAAEILFVARLHPETPCRGLTAAQWRRLAEATRAVLEEAIRYEGSTLSDGTYRNALNKQGGYQNEHRVYGKAGQACPRCGGKILRIVQAQRSTFYCATCQRKRA